MDASGTRLLQVDVRDGREREVPRSDRGDLGCLDLVAGPDDGSLRVWETTHGRAVVDLGGHRSVVASLAFSADGRSLASCDWSGEVRWWGR